jgi:hypothetical protein
VNTQFTYWILNYVHSQFIDERLNCGILFYFKNSNTFYFKYPRKFKRLKDTYHSFKEWQLKASLSAIDEKVKVVNEQNNGLFHQSLNELTLNSILVKDSTSLIFSDRKDAISNLVNVDELITKYYNLYFSEYKVDFKTIKHDEQYLLKKFKTKLSEKNETLQNYLKKDVLIKSTKTVVKFEYEWHNGVPNLIKPISFDLEDESSINNKAILLYGQLNFIKESLESKNYHIDLLISKPTQENKDLKTAYDKAIDILEGVNINKKLIVESKFDAYIEHVSEKIHAPEF